MSSIKNFVFPGIIFLLITTSFFVEGHPYSIKYPLLILAFFLAPFFLIITTEYFKDFYFELVLCILIFSFYNFSSLPYDIYLKDAVFVIILIFNLLVLFVYLNDTNKYPKIGFSFGDKLLLYLFVISFAISAFIFNSHDSFTPIGFSKYGAYLLSMFIVPIVTFRFFTKNIEMLDKFLLFLAIFGFITAIFGFMTVVIPGLNRHNVYLGTTISFFKHPNATSSIYNFTIPATLFLLLFRKEKFSELVRLFLVIIIFVSFMGLFFTFSRFGTVSVILSLTLLVYKYSKKLVIMFLLSLPIASVFLIYDIFLSKGIGTIYSRMGILATTIEMLKGPVNNLLWGYGIVSTTKIFESIKISLSVTDLNNVPHNIILYSILQYGLIPTVPIVLFVFKKCIQFIYNFFKNRCNEYQILSYSIIIFLIFKNMGEDLLIFPDFLLYYLFLIFWGISFIKSDTINLSTQ